MRVGSLVGYDVALTRRRPAVQIRLDPFFASEPESGMLIMLSRRTVKNNLTIVRMSSNKV